MESWNVGMKTVWTLACVVPLFTFQLSAQRHSITFEDYIALKAVSDPQLSPDGKWVAYTVSTPSLEDNRNVSRVWVVEVATGRGRQLTGGPGSDRQPRWSPDGKTLAFVSTRDSGAQVWVLPIAGGDAQESARGESERHAQEMIVRVHKGSCTKVEKGDADGNGEQRCHEAAEGSSDPAAYRGCDQD